MTSEPSIKISCRNVWKVYRRGSGKNQIAIPSGVDPRQHADTLRTQGDIVAAANVSFDILEGEIFVIMGLSGSGKSTLLRCMSRLVEPSAGEILLDGQNLLNASRAELTEIRRHKMGMVFQNFGLLPHLNVIDNVAFPLRAQGISLETRLARAHEVIDLVLLPIWTYAVRYAEDRPPIQILVNGQTGRVVGDKPLSTWKIGLTIGLGILLLLVFYVFVTVVM